MYIIQSILFKKSKFTIPNAIEWITSHKFKVLKLDESKDYYRFRQVAPNLLKKKGFTKFIQKPLGKSGVIYIIAYNETQGKGLFDFFTGRKSGLLPPNSRKLLEKEGNNKIGSILICRRPISSGTRALMKLLTLGKSTNINYDKVFHLFAVINHRFILEKNEVLNFDDKFTIDKSTDVVNVPLNKQITINELIENTRQLMGDSNFSTYRAGSLNCQHFLLHVLKANNLLNEYSEAFILQDAKAIIGSLPKGTEEVMNFATDLSARFNALRYGQGVKIE